MLCEEYNLNVLEDRTLRNEEATINEPYAANEEEPIKPDAKKSKIPHGIKIEMKMTAITRARNFIRMCVNFSLLLY